jgi:hypothetical protein
MTPETLFAFLILVQLIVIVCHDWIDIPGWTHGRQVQEVIGRTKLLWATAIDALFPGAAVMFAVWFWGRPDPRFVGTYWVVYCALMVLSYYTPLLPLTISDLRSMIGQIGSNCAMKCNILYMSKPVLLIS